MRFKYNFLTRKLYKLQEEYTCEVSEDHYFRYPSGIREGFLLGDQEQITFSFAQTFLKKYGKMLFKEDMLAYPPSWYKLSLKKQEKLATIMGNQEIKNKREIILELYQKVKLDEPNRKLLNNYCRSFPG